MKRILISAATEPTIKVDHQRHSYSLYRSKTEDTRYNQRNSPITQFVCNLLGLSNTSTRPKSRHHKSLSTTSITKGSVISSFQTENKPTSISAFVTDWGQHPPSDDDDKSSVSSITDTSSMSSKSPAIDALVNASLMPSKKVISYEFDNMPPITLINRRNDTEPVITVNIAEMIRPYVPRRYRIARQWDLVYSLDQHGASLSTLYSLMKQDDSPCILIIKDEKKQIFGAYLSHSLSSQTHYYGTGECFLWKLSYNQQNENKAIPKLKAFPWTGKNDYMILSDHHFIAIGGGNGKFGLWLDSNLHQGYTTTCPTFDNECLSLKSEFKCMEMEIWSLCL